MGIFFIKNPILPPLSFPPNHNFFMFSHISESECPQAKMHLKNPQKGEKRKVWTFSRNFVPAKFCLHERKQIQIQTKLRSFPHVLKKRRRAECERELAGQLFSALPLCHGGVVTAVLGPRIESSSGASEVSHSLSGFILVAAGPPMSLKIAGEVSPAPNYPPPRLGCTGFPKPYGVGWGSVDPPPPTAFPVFPSAPIFRSNLSFLQKKTFFERGLWWVGRSTLPSRLYPQPIESNVTSPKKMKEFSESFRSDVE